MKSGGPPFLWKTPTRAVDYDTPFQPRLVWTVPNVGLKT